MSYTLWTQPASITVEIKIHSTHTYTHIYVYHLFDIAPKRKLHVSGNDSEGTLTSPTVAIYQTFSQPRNETLP